MIEVYTDGASKGNPGRASIGIVIRKDNQTYTYKEEIGITTNNVAEYHALLKALNLLIQKQWSGENIRIYTDSELLYKQITGIYKVRSRELKSLYEKVSNLLKSFPSLEITWVPREANQRADRLANEALNEKNSPTEKENREQKKSKKELHRIR
jgi:ribonuclease HI